MRFEVQKTNKVFNMIVRAGIIKEAGRNIPTPLRVLNSKEIEHGQNLAKSKIVNLHFPHPVYELTRYFKPKTIFGLTRNMETSAALMKSLENLSNLAGNRFTLFHPIIDKKIEITDEINKKMIALQIGCNVDAVAILDEYNSTPRKFNKRLENSIQQIKDDEEVLEPMPIIKLDSDEKVFAEKINLVVENENVNILNLNYAPIKENFHNYLYLIKLASRNKTKNLWIHLSEVRKTFFKKCSPMHLLPLFSFDSYALNNRPIFFSKNKQKIGEKKEMEITRFDKGTLGFIGLKEHKELYGEDPNCDCFVEIKKKLSESIETYRGADLLSSALICHEAVASYRELLKSRERILTQRYKNYLKGKKYLQEPLKKLLKIDLAQQSLS
ncbi:unnamed protein product [marine sediment metagenome]|uniref:tRNA-guanine(15) transglycosylase-like domain-containing protein n=1 Tax=marine sediment metagenome TaxID=412755 RepID=X0SL79_9ZZZZ